MARITGTDAFNMMEAYNAVYAPQELTEEQVWEEVEAWVNSLVEGGHDLSEYTWEDMYEAYIEEQGRNRTSQATIDANRAALGNTILYGNPAGRTASKPTAQQQMRQRIQANRPAAPTPAAKPTPSAQQNLSGLSIGPGGFNINGRPVQTTPARPTTPAPAARPAAQAPARPAAAPARPAAQAPARPAAAPARPAAQAPARPATPTAKPTPTSTTPPTAPTAPARPSLRSDIADLQKMRLASQERQRKGGATVVGSQMASFDMFDVVQGYLIDEGYAETEEAAAVIMANMSEKWKESILESGYFPTKESQREDEKKYRMGSNVKHRTVQTQAKPTPSNLK